MHNPVAEHNPSAYRPDIDGLRAVAVLVVVVFHAFPTVLRGGFVGVDIFFVISGYLISGIIFRQTRQGTFSLATFYANRVRRIFPALLAVLATCGVAGWILLLPQEYSLLGKHMASGAAFVQNIVLQQEAGYFDVRSDLKPLLHLWSLAIEEQFYLIYPLIMLLAWRAGKNMLAALLILGVVSFGLNLYVTKNNLVTAFFWPHTRMWELLAGAGLAYLQQRTHGTPHDRTPSRWSNPSAWAGLLLVSGAVLGLSKAHHFPGGWALLPVAGAVCLIAAGPASWVSRRLLASRPLVAVGLISYPLYLWHWPLLSFAAIIEDGAASRGMRAGMVALALLLAWLTYRFLELPLRYGSHKRMAVRALTAGVAAVAVMGYGIHTLQGFEQRFPMVASQAIYDKWTWGSNAECTKRYPQLQGIPYCLLGPDEPPEVALIGDSHANHYYPGLQQAGLKLINLGKGSCLPFLGVTTHSPLPRPQGEVCPPDHIDRAIEFAIAQPSIRTIALAGRFQQYYEDASEAKVFTGPQAARLSGNSLVFETTLEKTLGRLTATGKRIVYILDNPDPLFDPKECIRLPPLRRQHALRSPCAAERASIDQRHAGHRATALRVLAKFPNVHVFDPFKTLCDAQYCWAARGQEILYRDGDHLSLQGSRFIAGPLLAVLQPAF